MAWFRPKDLDVLIHVHRMHDGITGALARILRAELLVIDNRSVGKPADHHRAVQPDLSGHLCWPPMGRT